MLLDMTGHISLLVTVLLQQVLHEILQAVFIIHQPAHVAYFLPQLSDLLREHEQLHLEYSLMPNPTQSRSFQRHSSQSITWLILTNKTVQENTQTKYNSGKANNAKYRKKQNYPDSVASYDNWLGMRWAYSTMLLSPHRAAVTINCCLLTASKSGKTAPENTKVHTGKYSLRWSYSP